MTMAALRFRHTSLTKVTLTEPLLDDIVADVGRPDRLICDRATDNNPFRERL